VTPMRVWEVDAQVREAELFSLAGLNAHSCIQSLVCMYVYVYVCVYIIYIYIYACM
jgi:hypothetical protein